MAEIALAVVEPNGRRWAQLLDDERAVSEVLRVVLTSLRLPKDFKYELVPTKTRRPLDEAETLRQAGVKAGDELRLQPERDTLLAQFLEDLYEEAKGYVEDKLWEQAEERLETLFRLDPYYPDRTQLRRAVETRSSVGPAKAKEAKPSGTRAAPPSAATPVPAAQPAAPPAAPAKGASLGGCLTKTLAAIVVLSAVTVATSDTALQGLRDFVSDVRTELEGGRSGLRARAGEPVLGTGDVQVTLRWNTAADLDLHVIDPSGQEIWYSDKSSDSGGQLDVDANAACQEQAAAPVENVFWPTHGAPSGQYEVFVEYFQDCVAAGATDYEVTITLDGRVFDSVSGTVGGESERQPVRAFRYEAD